MSPPGTIAVLADEQARYSRFSLSMAGLNAPAGSKIKYGIGRNIAEQTNKIIRDLAPGHEWVWLQGDDHVFSADLLMNLLAHNVDVVAPLVLHRMAPFRPVVYGEEVSDGMHRYLDFSELPSSGLTEVFACGSAGLLLRKNVLDAVGDPWLEFTPIMGGVMGEDLSLCRKIRNAGFKIHVDLDNFIGHLFVAAAWPAYHEGEWVAHLDFNQGAT